MDAQPKGSIARAALVLNALATSPGEIQLAEVARSTSFSKTTAHRVLASLIKVNFVVQEPKSRGYRLGSALAELGQRAGHQEISVLSQPMLNRLAVSSEDTVFISIPEGNAAVCVGREVGRFPIRTLTLDRGDRRPLGVGAGSLAIYCAMPEAARKRVCQQNLQWMSDYGDFSWQRLEKDRQFYKQFGYAENRGGIVQGMSAIAVPVLNHTGRVAAAFTIAAINERMTEERIRSELAPALQREAELLTKSLTDAFKGKQIT